MSNASNSQYYTKGKLSRVSDDQRYKSLRQLPRWAKELIQQCPLEACPHALLREIKKLRKAGGTEEEIREIMENRARAKCEREHLAAYPGIEKFLKAS